MLARAHTFTIDGLAARRVAVEVDIRSGLPAFAIVGLADAAVREARDRVRAAILNSGFEFPSRRITANLAPGDVPKVGPGLDLAMACAILAASGQLEPQRLEQVALFGELGLDGAVRPCHGTLAIAQAAHDSGLRGLLLAPSRAREAQLVEGLRVYPVARLPAAVRVLSGGPPDPAPAGAPAAGGAARHEFAEPDFADVRGQHAAVWALVVAAAGGHNTLLSGPPGTGKTMLAQRMPSILPPMSRGEAIEVTRIHSIVGTLRDGELITRRPFRAPHHSISTAGLVGGARRTAVGEVVLAHNGVLFLDELSEFTRPALEALRQPLEDGRVAIVRADRSTLFPARIMLLAATNPCPCGHAGEERCHCSEADLARHRRKLSGPLLDRLDLLVHLENGRAGQLRAEPFTSSADARARVREARARQAARLRGETAHVNARMDAAMLRRHVALDERAQALLESAYERGSLSTRGAHRALRVARTLADLHGSERVAAEHVAEALALRPEERASARALSGVA